LAEHGAGLVLHRLRAGDAARMQMLHQAEKERQVLGGDPALVEREDEIAPAGMDQEVGVLDPLRDALVGEQLAHVVPGDKGRAALRRDVGVDGHAYSAASVSLSTRGSGKNMLSSAVVTVSTLTV